MKVLVNKTGEIIEARDKEDARMIIKMCVSLTNSRNPMARDNKNNYTIIED